MGDAARESAILRVGIPYADIATHLLNELKERELTEQNIIAEVIRIYRAAGSSDPEESARNFWSGVGRRGDPIERIRKISTKGDMQKVQKILGSRGADTSAPDGQAAGQPLMGVAPSTPEAPADTPALQLSQIMSRLENNPQFQSLTKDFAAAIVNASFMPPGEVGKWVILPKHSPHITTLFSSTRASLGRRAGGRRARLRGCSLTAIGQ